MVKKGRGALVRGPIEACTSSDHYRLGSVKGNRRRRRSASKKAEKRDEVGGG